MDGAAIAQEFPPQVPRKMQPIDAVLFDMDGTILNSIKAAERIWAKWAIRHGLDVEKFLPTIHGQRAIETVRGLGLPNVDPEAEAAAITRAEIEDVDGIEAIAGAAEFLGALPRTRWAIVTSAPKALALRRIEAAGLPTPPLMVTAEDVKNGKPAPDCFRMAAEMLGTTAERCLVVEDSPAGITAAECAGASVLVVTATHRHPTAISHWNVIDYRELAVEQLADGSVSITGRRKSSDDASSTACVLRGDQS
jgi:sugar-phosphatase